MSNKPKVILKKITEDKYEFVELDGDGYKITINSNNDLIIEWDRKRYKTERDKDNKDEDLERFELVEKE
jgi:hypothetical protein